MSDLKHVSGLIEDTYRDIRSAVVDGYNRTRRSKRKSSQKQKPEVARFKMQIYFSDGNCRYFYSHDWQLGSEGSKRHDEWIGLAALIAQRVEWMDVIETVSIYVNLDDKRPLTLERNYNHIVFKQWINKVGELCESEIPQFPFLKEGGLDLYKSKMLAELDETNKRLIRNNLKAQFDNSINSLA